MRSFRGLEVCNLVTTTIDVSKNIEKNKTTEYSFVDALLQDCRPKTIIEINKLFIYLRCQ